MIKALKSDNFITLFKGMIIGGTMLVPGVSGGSMAMILGIYNRLISSVSSFTKNKRGNLVFLLLFSIGAGIGMVLFANPLLALIESYPKPMLYLFLGAVAGGIPMIFKEAKVKKINWELPVYIAFGFMVVVVFSMLPMDLVQTGRSTGVMLTLMLVLCGSIAAIALVLPGISVSYMLLLMGLYDKTMKAITQMDIGFLLPIAIGGLAGILLVTKFLEFVMTKFPKETYLIILGFVIGSLLETFPGIPNGWDWVLCIMTGITGFLLIYRLSKLELTSL